MIPSEIELAASEWNEICYRLLLKKNYDFASKMLRFGIEEMKKKGDEATRKRMIVNLANSEKLAGRKEMALKILAAEDWSAVSDEFAICVAAVKDNLNEVIVLMGRVSAANTIRPIDFREWPVFEPLRTLPDFIVAFENHDGEALLLDKDAGLGESDLDGTSSSVDLDGDGSQGEESDEEKAKPGVVLDGSVATSVA